MSERRKSPRISTSFTPAEVELLARVVRNALRAGGTARELVSLRRRFEALHERALHEGASVTHVREVEAKAS